MAGACVHVDWWHSYLLGWLFAANCNDGQVHSLCLVGLLLVLVRAYVFVSSITYVIL